jgi:hypothetical protein
MAVHRRLVQQYQQRRIAGWTHDEAMSELNECCGLPVAWKGARSFTGEFDPFRLQVSWIVNGVLLLGLAALVMWNLLNIASGQLVIDLPKVLTTLVIGMLITPLIGIGLALGVKAVFHTQGTWRSPTRMLIQFQLPLAQLARAIPRRRATPWETVFVVRRRKTYFKPATLGLLRQPRTCASIFERLARIWRPLNRK